MIESCHSNAQSLRPPDYQSASHLTKLLGPEYTCTFPCKKWNFTECSLHQLVNKMHLILNGLEVTFHKILHLSASVHWFRKQFMETNFYNSLDSMINLKKKLVLSFFFLVLSFKRRYHVQSKSACTLCLTDRVQTSLYTCMPL